MPKMITDILSVPYVLTFNIIIGGICQLNSGNTMEQIGQHKEELANLLAFNLRCTK